jgi:hypothetical protein
MHPVEHLLYWSDILIHLILPSHPLLVLYHLQVTGSGAVIGHVGLYNVAIGAGATIDTQAYAHYLHHKCFEVNCADGLLPCDRWFETWQDGTKDGGLVMKARLARKKGRSDVPRAPLLIQRIDVGPTLLPHRRGLPACCREANVPERPQADLDPGGALCHQTPPSVSSPSPTLAPMSLPGLDPTGDCPDAVR